MKIQRGYNEASVTYPEFKGKTVRKVLDRLYADEVITLKEYTKHVQKKDNCIYSDLDEKVTGCHEYHSYLSNKDDGHHVVVGYLSGNRKQEVYLKVRKAMWIEKGDSMKVSEVLKMTRGVTVQNEIGDSNFDGWIVLKKKGKEKFGKALDCDCWFCGSETVIVKGNKTEIRIVKELFDSIDGDCTADEWDSWFREPTDKEWDKYEQRMIKKYGKSWQLITEA